STGKPCTGLYDVQKGKHFTETESKHRRNGVREDFKFRTAIKKGWEYLQGVFPSTVLSLHKQRDVRKRPDVEDPPLRDPDLGDDGQGEEREVHEGVCDRTEAPGMLLEGREPPHDLVVGERRHQPGALEGE